MSKTILNNTPFCKEEDLETLSSVKKKMLCPDEQRKLLIKARKGNIEARNILLESNIPFVMKFAKQFLYRGVDFDELVSEGCLALNRAIDKFDLDKQNSFISYSAYWVKFYMLRLVNDNSFIKKPVNKIRELSILNKVKNEICNTQKSYSMTLLEEEAYIAKELNISTKKIEKIRALQQGIISLDAKVSSYHNSDSKFNTVMDILVDDKAVCPETYVLDKDIKMLLDNCLNTLTKREADIIKDRFGLGDGKARNLNELSRKYQLSRERVRQIEIRVTKKLRGLFSRIGFSL